MRRSSTANSTRKSNSAALHLCFLSSSLNLAACLNKDRGLKVYLSVMRAFIFSFCTFFLAACTAAQPTAAIFPATPSARIPLTSTSSPSPTNAPLPSETATATITATPSPSPTAVPERLPDPASAGWQSVVSGLEKPVGVTNAANGSSQLFVIEQRGVVRIVKDNALLPTPFLDIRDRAGSREAEQGLLGLAFHPNYRQNGLFYVNYTNKEGNTVIARFSTLPSDPARADPTSEKRLLQIKQPYPNHNGGQLAFGPDGFLYIGLGDGGSAGDPLGNAQSLQSLLGKILRIDVDHGDPYGIPSNNPFANGGGLPEIWAYGLRNPWRFSFDRQTGDLYIGDVGQDAWEEIDFLPAGSPGGVNFGWNVMEGLHPYHNEPISGATLTPPVAEYGHDQGCSVTGGVTYRGSSLPEWQGVYLFGDFCSGNVWGLRHIASQDEWRSALLYSNLGKITAFGEDEAGEVYFLDYAGILYKLITK